MPAVLSSLLSKHSEVQGSLQLAQLPNKHRQLENTEFLICHTTTAPEVLNPSPCCEALAASCYPGSSKEVHYLWALRQASSPVYACKQWQTVTDCQAIPLWARPPGSQHAVVMLAQALLLAVSWLVAYAL